MLTGGGGIREVLGRGSQSTFGCVQVADVSGHGAVSHERHRIRRGDAREVKGGPDGVPNGASIEPRFAEALLPAVEHDAQVVHPAGEEQVVRDLHVRGSRLPQTSVANSGSCGKFLDQCVLVPVYRHLPNFGPLPSSREP